MVGWSEAAALAEMIGQARVVEVTWLAAAAEQAVMAEPVPVVGPVTVYEPAALAVLEEVP